MWYDRNIIGTSSEIFGYLRQSSVIFGKCLENVRRRSSSLRKNFGESSEIFGKWSEIFGKSSKTSLLICLYNKQNNTWTLGDMEFIFSCSHSISHSFAALTRSISMWTLEDKFHTSARPCIILYLNKIQALENYSTNCNDWSLTNYFHQFAFKKRKKCLINNFYLQVYHCCM